MCDGMASTSLMSSVLCADPQRLIEEDARRDYGERRFHLLCLLRGHLYHVTFTKRARISASSPPAAPTNGSNDTTSGAPITKALTTTDGRVLIEQPDGTYRPVESQTDWARLDAMTEEEVERLAAEDMAEVDIDPDWMTMSQWCSPGTRSG